MLTLCGFAISNYYNKVKLVLLEKGLPFDEQLVMTRSKDEAVLSASPLGKVPFLRTEHGNLCESQVIVDYLEAAYPNPPLVPADPFAAAKVRELVTFIDLHLELVARELYPLAFFGGTVDDATKERVRKQLTRQIGGFKRLAKFSPLRGGRAVHAGRLRGVREPAAGGHGDEDRARRRPARQRGRRLEDLHAHDRRTPQRTARGGRSQGGRGRRQALIRRRAPPGRPRARPARPSLPCGIG
jgi:glutathione S-transferase